MTSLSSSKKALEMSLEQIVGLIIVAFVIFISVVIFVKLYDMFTGRPDQGTEESFNLLIRNINELRDGPPPFEMTFYIDDHHSLVGFSKGIQSVPANTGFGYVGIFRVDPQVRPPECGDINSACLCICESTRNCASGYKKCSVLRGIEFIRVRSLDNNLGGEHLFLLADHAFYNSFRVGTLQIEKQGTTLYVSGRKKA